jgi:hypothetical protein
MEEDFSSPFFEALLHIYMHTYTRRYTGNMNTFMHIYTHIHTYNMYILMHTHILTHRDGNIKWPEFKDIMYSIHSSMKNSEFPSWEKVICACVHIHTCIYTHAYLHVFSALVYEKFRIPFMGKR